MRVLLLLLALTAPAKAGEMSFGNNNSTVVGDINGQAITPGSVTTPLVNATTVQILQDNTTAAWAAIYPNAPLVMLGNANSYLQAVIQNLNNGTLAQSALVLTGDLGSDTSYYANIQMSNSRFSNPSYAVFPSSSMVLYASDAPVYVWADTNGGQYNGSGGIVFGSSNAVAANAAMYIGGATAGGPGPITVRSSFTVVGSTLLVQGYAKFSSTSVLMDGSVSTLPTLVLDTNATGSRTYMQYNNIGVEKGITGISGSAGQHITGSAALDMNVRGASGLNFSGDDGNNLQMKFVASNAILSSVTVTLNGTGANLVVAGSTFTVANSGIITGAGQPGVKAIITPATSAMANATFTSIFFDTEEFDTQGMHSVVTSSNVFTVPVGGAGVYFIQCTIGWASAALGERTVRLVNSGVSIEYIRASFAAVGTAMGTQVTEMSYLSAGATRACQGFQSSTGSLNYTGSATPSPTSFTMQKIW